MLAFRIYRTTWLHGLRVAAVFLAVAAVVALHVALIAVAPLLVLALLRPEFVAPALWGLALLAGTLAAPLCLGVAARTRGGEIDPDEAPVELTGEGRIPGRVVPLATVFARRGRPKPESRTAARRGAQLRP